MVKQKDANDEKNTDLIKDQRTRESNILFRQFKGQAEARKKTERKRGKRKGEKTEEGKEGGRESEKVYTTFGLLEMSTQSQFASHGKNILL